jgi:hypothetical protein
MLLGGTREIAVGTDWLGRDVLSGPKNYVSKVLEHRQHETTGAQRIWYRLNDSLDVVFVTKASGHPGETD